MSQDDFQEVFREEDKTAFGKISHSVGSTEWQIIENKARHEAWIKILESQQNKIDETKLKTMIAKQQHCQNLKLQQEMVEKSNTSAMNNIAFMERSIVYYLDLLNRSNMEKHEVKEKHANILKMYENQYEEIEKIHKDVNPAHHDLHVIQTMLMRNKIELKKLNARIQTCDRAKQQFDDTQKRIYEQNMVSFAKFYVSYHKKEKNLQELKILNEEKSKHFKEHLQLVATAKKEGPMEAEKRTHVSAKKIEQTVAHVTAGNNKGDCYSKQLEDFIKADVKPLRKNFTAVKTTALETSKIKILNVTEFEPPRKIIKKFEGDVKTPGNLDVEFKKPKDLDKSSKFSKKILPKKSVRFQECERTPKKQEKIHPSPPLFSSKDKNPLKELDNKWKQMSDEPKKSTADMKRLCREMLTKTTQRLSQEPKPSSQRSSQEIKLSGQRSSQETKQSLSQRLSQETKHKRLNQPKKSETAQQRISWNQNGPISSMETNVSQGFLFGNNNEIGESGFQFNASLHDNASELSAENENNYTMDTDDAALSLAEKHDFPGGFGNFSYQTPNFTPSYGGVNFDVL